MAPSRGGDRQTQGPEVRFPLTKTLAQPFPFDRDGVGENIHGGWPRLTPNMSLIARETSLADPGHPVPLPPSSPDDAYGWPHTPSPMCRLRRARSIVTAARGSPPRCCRSHRPALLHSAAGAGFSELGGRYDNAADVAARFGSRRGLSAQRQRLSSPSSPV